MIARWLFQENHTCHHSRVNPRARNQETSKNTAAEIAAWGALRSGCLTTRRKKIRISATETVQIATTRSQTIGRAERDTSQGAILIQNGEYVHKSAEKNTTTMKEHILVSTALPIFGASYNFCACSDLSLLYEAYNFSSQADFYGVPIESSGLRFSSPVLNSVKLLASS